ncbi:sugar ABC transporter substrate-binding protein [Paenibacillus chitinolyticus]|uniref:ABC transporter substrate-binding protein n=1 Tax=Paenibacillus chitinolyticus TaxID=79263 RepID=UPI0026E4AFF0|nr:extracellular solute-binding protein [Paenibacillus chitinolyticus]GKS10646.1 sugar ABC transporter substrate-binding protein [Paenibacillus chitinolyticus]
MKKATAWVLICVMLAITVLSGCGKSEEGSAGKDSSGKQVTIKYYNWDNETQAQSTKKYIDQFQEKYPNIKVQHISLVPGNSLESLKKLDVLLTSGEKVDVVMFPSISELDTRVANKVLAPLDEFYAKDNVKPEEEYFVNPKFEGKYYGIQNNITTNFVLLNKDALDEAGLPVPKLGWTWDEFREYAKKLNKGEGTEKRYGAYFHNWPMYANPDAQIYMQHPFLTEEGKTNFDSPTYTYFFNLRRAMEKEDKTAKPYADVIGAKLNYRAEFFNQKAAMLLSGSWMISEIGDTQKFPHTFKTAIAPVPVQKKGDPTDMFMGGNYMSVGASSEHKQEAYQFMRFMSTNLTDARAELPGWKKGDAKPLAERLIGQNKDLYDVDSLMYTLFGAGIKALPPSKNSISYAAALDKILTDGFSMFILDNKKVEDVQKWMVDEANKVIEKNKK